MAAADCLTFNLHVAAKAWQAAFPVVIQFVHPCVEQFCFLGRLIGTGKLAFLSQAVLLPRNEDRPYESLELKFTGAGGDTHFPITSHKYFTALLAEAALLSGADPDAIGSFMLRRWDFVRDESVSHFRVRLVSVLTEVEISCRVGNRVKTAADDELPFGIGSNPTDRFAGKRKTPSSAKAKAGAASSSSKAAKTCGVSKSKKSKLDDDSDAGCNSSIDSVHSERSWSSDTGDEQPIDSDSDAVDEPPKLPKTEWNDTGIKCWELCGPKSKPTCEVCSHVCKAGTIRFDYRYKKSDSLRDQKRIHPECVLGLPKDTRHHDMQLLLYWSKNSALSPAVRAAAKAARDKFVAEAASS